MKFCNNGKFLQKPKGRNPRCNVFVEQKCELSEGDLRFLKLGCNVLKTFCPIVGGLFFFDAVGGDKFFQKPNGRKPRCNVLFGKKNRFSEGDLRFLKLGCNALKTFCPIVGGHFFVNAGGSDKFLQKPKGRKPRCNVFVEQKCELSEGDLRFLKLGCNALKTFCPIVGGHLFVNAGGSDKFFQKPNGQKPRCNVFVEQKCELSEGDLRFLKLGCNALKTFCPIVGGLFFFDAVGGDKFLQKSKVQNPQGHFFRA